MEFDRMGVEEIKQSIREKLENNFGCGLSDATPQQLYQAVARTVRDEVMRRRTASRGVRKTERKKKVLLSVRRVPHRPRAAIPISSTSSTRTTTRQALKELESTKRPSLSWSRNRAWATAASAAWRPAFWTP